MNYHFFWKSRLSQWARCDFVVDGVKYNCCEQWMMAEKARLFGDDENEGLILQSLSPRLQKSLGREVFPFDVASWEEIRENGRPMCWNIVWCGNMARFSQNEDDRDLLFSTGDKLIVEASPDPIWGNGLREMTAEQKLSHNSWPGRNWLGEVLTCVRDDLRLYPCEVFDSIEKLDEFLRERSTASLV